MQGGVTAGPEDLVCSGTTPRTLSFSVHYDNSSLFGLLHGKGFPHISPFFLNKFKLAKVLG